MEALQERERALRRIDEEIDRKQEAVFATAQQVFATKYKADDCPPLEQAVDVDGSECSLSTLLVEDSEVEEGMKSSSLAEEKNQGSMLSEAGAKCAIRPTVRLRLQKAQISTLGKNTGMLREKVQTLEKRQTVRTKHLKEAKENLRTTCSQLKQKEIELTALRTQFQAMKTRFHDLEVNCSELKTQAKRMDSVNTKLRAESATKEKALVKGREETDKLRHQFKHELGAERKAREAAAQQLVHSMHCLEEKKGQLQQVLTGFKKQANLIDILKKQNLQLEATKLLCFTEQEFLKLINTDTAMRNH